MVRAVATGVRSEEEFVQRLRGEGLIVTPRYVKGDRGSVVGYKVAAKTGGREPLVFYGGGTLGKDLRLPALRARWNQPAGDAAAWAKPTTSKPKAEPRNVAAASDALRRAADAIHHIPAGDHAAWQRVTADTAGVLSAAATVSTDPQARRALMGAAQALHRATPGIDPAAPLSTAPATCGARQPRSTGPNLSAWASSKTPRAGPPPPCSAASLGCCWPARPAEHRATARRRYSSSKPSSWPHRSPEPSRHGSKATQAQQRAVTACTVAQNATTAAAAARSGWQFTKTGAEIIDAARHAAPVPDAGVVPRHVPGPEQGIGR